LPAVGDVVVSDGDDEKRDAFRPRIGGRGGEIPQERVPRFRNRLLARIARLGGAPGGVGSRPRGTPSARDVRRPGAHARRCIVKARFVPMNAYGKRAAALHLAYVERDGVEQDGSPGRLYGPDGTADVREALSAPMEGEKRQFRFIVSPEDGAEADLTALARRLMAQVEVDLSRPLVWGAVNHWNTDNPHVHVVVRGVDEDGRDVTIDGRYLSEGMRSRVQEILTRELGPRTQLHMDEQLSREVRQERFTSFDRTLRACQESGGVLLETRLPLKEQASGSRLMARLGHLEKLGLVSRASAVEWRFRDDWAETLRGLGEARDIVKRMYAAVPVADPSRFVILDGSTALPAVEGVVRGKGLHDELAGRPFAIIEGIDGRLLYAPIDVSAAERIREGDVVRLVADRGPTKSPEVAGKGPSPPARPGICVQRLGGPIVAQATYRGPTWLDAVAATSPPRDTGAFAAELADSLARREAALAAMRVDAREPAGRVAALIALEARTVGLRLADERGFTFVASPVGLTGTLTLAEKLPSGRQYAIVADEQLKQLWVIPASKPLRALEGQRVEGWRAPDGRLLVSAAGPDRAPRAPER
jgi:type IV secretory pathway VirD2 relaxase